MAKANFSLSKQQQQIIFLVLLVGVGGGFSYFKYFWTPTSLRIAETTVKIDEIEAKISKAKGQAARLEKIKQELEILNQQAGEAEKQLPKKKDLPAVIDTVSLLSTKYSVHIQSFAPGGQTASQYFIELPYVISMRGGYHMIAKFFAALALEERIFNVRNVSYSGPDSEGYLTISFTLVSYQYKG